jgi:hypothetical protein
MQMEEKDMIHFLVWAVNGLLSVIMSILAFVLHDTRKELSDVKRELNDHKVEAAKTYAPISDIKDLHEKVDKGFNRIVDMLQMMSQKK